MVGFITKFPDKVGLKSFDEFCDRPRIDFDSTNKLLKDIIEVLKKDEFNSDGDKIEEIEMD